MYSPREEPCAPTSPQGIVVVALLMMTFGLAEVATGITHHVFGISTARVTLSAYAGAAIGVIYAVAGLLILSMKRRAAALATPLLVADIIGRIAMAVMGLYPVDSLKQTLAIILGTALAAGFAIYITWKRSAFNYAAGPCSQGYSGDGRPGRSLLVGNLQAVADPRFSQDVTGVGWVRFDLAAELVHQDVEIVQFPVIPLAPDGAQQTAVRHNFSGVLDEIGEGDVFLRREMNRGSAARHQTPFHIDRNIADPDDRPDLGS